MSRYNANKISKYAIVEVSRIYIYIYIYGKNRNIFASHTKAWGKMEGESRRGRETGMTRVGGGRG